MDELEALVDSIQIENDKRAAGDPLTQRALETVETFLRNHPVMCYGGTAINNLLPKKDRFYNPETDIPDYDFFSRTPQEHAMILANQLHAKGIKNIEVKPGVHLGTFKVFADFEGVADITELNPEIFERLWETGRVLDGIHYVPPDFLRMSMYLELSRPRGDVSRWTKVYTRLLLLNKHYPIVCSAKPARRTPVPPDVRRSVKSLLQTEDVVLLGVNAAETHLGVEWTLPITLLATKETIERLTAGQTVTVDEGSEILPPRYSVETPVPIRFYETTACHSYHDAGGIRVASIPTILQFFFAFLYSSKPDHAAQDLLCVAQRLMDLADHKPKRRFEILTPVDCIGTQMTLVDMRKEKAVLYEKTSTRKTSSEFLRYFFTYTPTMTKTQKTKLRAALRKTRRAGSS